CAPWSKPRTPRAAPPPTPASGGSSPMRSATPPCRRRSRSTCASGSRASCRRSAAIARRWASTTRSRGSTKTTRGSGSERSTSAARRSNRPTARRSSSSENPLKSDLFDILRCPYCGGALDLVESLFHRTDGDDVRDGILGCQCCIFPVVDGIPVLHLQPDAALRTMIGIDSAAGAEAFEAAARSASSTYRETVDALGPNFEGGYFLYRFSDPTYIVAEAVVRSVA